MGIVKEAMESVRKAVDGNQKPSGHPIDPKTASKILPGAKSFHDIEKYIEQQKKEKMEQLKRKNKWDKSPTASGSKDKSSPVRRSRSPVKRSPDRRSPARRDRSPYAERIGQGIGKGKPPMRGIGSRSPVERKRRSPGRQSPNRPDYGSYYKTRPCKFFQMGKCENGDNCNYIH